MGYLPTWFKISGAMNGNNEVYHRQCEPTPAGYRTNWWAGSGKTLCMQCDDGWYSLPSSDRCAMCPPGVYGVGVSTTSECSGPCTCPTGQYCPAGSTSPTSFCVSTAPPTDPNGLSPGYGLPSGNSMVYIARFDSTMVIKASSKGHSWPDSSGKSNNGGVDATMPVEAMPMNCVQDSVGGVCGPWHDGYRNGTYFGWVGSNSVGVALFATGSGGLGSFPGYTFTATTTFMAVIQDLGTNAYGFGTAMIGASTGSPTAAGTPYNGLHVFRSGTALYMASADTRSRTVDRLTLLTRCGH